MSPAEMQRPFLVDITADKRKEQLDTLEQWLGNVLMAQSMFTEIVTDTIDKVHTPHIKADLEEMKKRAQHHLNTAEELFRVIGRDPMKSREMGAPVMAKAREALTDIESKMLGGAAGAWGDVHELFLTNLKSTGAFGTAMQLASALGIPEVGKKVLPIMEEKFADQRWLQETLMETAGIAILKGEPI